jgi:hypothetical protein
VLLVTDQAVPNVLGALVQLGSQPGSTFVHFNTIFPVDAVSLDRIDHIDGGAYLLGLPFWVLV